MTRDELLNSLILTAADQAVTFDDTYFDWSVETSDGWRMEVGDGTESVVVDLTREQMAALHAALTRTLLRDAA